MIINKDMYECPKCNKIYLFETSKEYTAICSDCNCELTFIDNYDCDTELAEQRKNAPKYDPTQDPNSKYYIPVVKCPYCHSTNTKKISGLSKASSVALLGIFALGKTSKQWHCNQCNSDF